MEQDRKGENRTETGMHTRLNTRKTSWLNGTGQKSDGIICTRKTPSALSRWALCYNMQSRIASQTREVFCADPADGIVHNEYS